jgi:BirA family transcriptional regulator, biotin operon repressor / biotin---[acetyl-CoA-carboxylase] ligase
MQFTILRFDTLPSTNTEAARQAKLGAPEGMCVVARAQSSGRGRRERSWHSPLDAGLYFSLVLRPAFETRRLPLITLAAAVAVADSLRESCDLTTDIKWANDIYASGKKMSGILAETVDTPNGLAVILGIGINLKNDAIAPDLKETATTIEGETGAAPDTEKLLLSLTRNLKKYYETLSGAFGDAEIIDAWTARSSYAFGKRVRVALENESFTGTTDGLEASGALRVRTENGLMKIVHAGDVVSLRQHEENK